MKAPKPVASAVNAIDSWTLITDAISQFALRVGITMHLLAPYQSFRAGHAYSTLEDGQAVARLPTLRSL